MSSRRDFLTTMAAGLTATALADRWAMAADAATIKSPSTGPSASSSGASASTCPRTLPGAWPRCAAMGFHDRGGGRPLEAAPRPSCERPSIRPACAARRAHMGLERLRDDLPGRFRGSQGTRRGPGRVPVDTPQEGFTRDDAHEGGRSLQQGFGKAAARSRAAFRVSLPRLRVRAIAGRDAVRHAGQGHSIRS